MVKRNPFRQEIILIGGKCYRVEDYPSDEVIQQKGSEAFKKGFAYRYITSLQRRIYPYHGVIEDYKEFHFKELPVGIYHVRKHDELYLRIIFPRTKYEAEEHALKREQSVMSAVKDAYQNNQFVDPTLSALDSGVSRFIPPIHEDDDMLNKIVKLAIRLKDAPFDPYGKRLRSLAVEKNHGMEGTNIMNNFKRSLRFNHSMSPNKGIQAANVYQFDLAIVVKDKEDAMHPISDDGTPYVYYPMGIPFEFDSKTAIDAGPLIEQAIIDDKLREEEYEKEMNEND